LGICILGKDRKGLDPFSNAQRGIERYQAAQFRRETGFQNKRESEFFPFSELQTLPCRPARSLFAATITAPSSAPDSRIVLAK